MAKPVQISAPISQDTKDLMEHYAKVTGVKQGHLVETALRYHLRALHELPGDVLVPPRIVLSRASFERVAERLRSPGAPTAALRELMGGDGD